MVLHMDMGIMVGKKSIFVKSPKRLFTFGCSFTQWWMPTWANILSYDLDIPTYNYGLCAAGNQYIFNSLMQADCFYKFNEDDLIMICWTNISREDRYKEGQWIVSGNIYSAEPLYDKTYIKKWADEYGYAVRDFALIKASWEFLNSKKCQFHFLKMLDFSRTNQKDPSDTKDISTLEDFYGFYIDQIEDSFYKVLWNNDLDAKIRIDKNIHPKYVDMHPLPSEHLSYLTSVFDHNFKDETKTKISEIEIEIKKNIVDTLNNGKSIQECMIKNYQFGRLETIDKL